MTTYYERFTTRPCPECGGKRIAAELTSTWGGLGLKRAGKIFSIPTGLFAVVCTNCGYTSLYAKDPFMLEEKGKK